MSSSLTPEQRDTYDRTGVLRLPGLLSGSLAQAARAAILARLAARGLWRDGAWQVDAAPRPQWPASPLKTRDIVGNRHPEFEAMFAAPALAAVVDELMDGRAVDRQVHRRPQVLFTLPNIDAWVLPGGWHCDGARLASGRKPGIQVWVMLERVEPRGGGTLVVAGSHRLANDEGRFLPARDLRKLLLREPFFQRLWAPTPEPWPQERALPAGAVGDVAVEVVELTGEIGDVWVTDALTLHSGAPNAREIPRLMITNRYLASEVVRELAEGHGWV